jgi:hypothetical protein
MNLEVVRDEIKTTSPLSNSAKLLAGYMKATGLFEAKALAEALAIPLRTIQRLKLEIACANDATDGVYSECGASASRAISATDGVATCANSAVHGVSESANDATGGASQKEIPPIPPKEKTTPPSTSVETNNSAQQQSCASESAALPASADLSDRLIEACNGSLDNPVNCMGLLSVGIPQMWIREGCDLELDILPTLQAAGKKHHGKRIRSWSYFTPMIAEAKAKRLAGMPAVSAGQAPAAGRPSAARAVLAARKAREEAHA